MTFRQENVSGSKDIACKKNVLCKSWKNGKETER